MYKKVKIVEFSPSGESLHTHDFTFDHNIKPDLNRSVAETYLKRCIVDKADKMFTVNAGNKTFFFNYTLVL